MNKQPQQIGIWVKASERLPTMDGKYTCRTIAEDILGSSIPFRSNDDSQKEKWVISQIEWLEQTTAILLSVEEYENLVNTAKVMTAIKDGLSNSYKNLLEILREVVMRCDIMYPEKEDDFNWHNEGIKHQEQLYKKIVDALGLGKLDELLK